MLHEIESSRDVIPALEAQNAALLRIARTATTTTQKSLDLVEEQSEHIDKLGKAVDRGFFEQPAVLLIGGVILGGAAAGFTAWAVRQ